MSVLVDTGVLFAFINRSDRHHARAKTILDACLHGRHGTAVTTTFVVDELLTLLRARGHEVGVPLASKMVGLGEQGGGVRLLDVDAHDVQATHRHFLRHAQRGLSFTDCSHLAVMERHGIDWLATFDGGFDGLVETVSG